MRADSSLSKGQRFEAVALFEAGYGPDSAASRLQVGIKTIRNLYDRWRIHGNEALVDKPSKKAFSFEVKHEIVLRAIEGEAKIDLAREFRVSSPKLIETWLRTYRAQGKDGLLPKPKGRPRGDPGTPAAQESELERLQRENQWLRAENAYLGKLRALRNQGRR